MVHEGVNKETHQMIALDVADVVSRPSDKTVWTGRWCHRKKWVGPDTDDIICRSRWVVRQFKNLVDGDCFSGCPGLEAVRVLWAVALA